MKYATIALTPMLLAKLTENILTVVAEYMLQPPMKRLDWIDESILSWQDFLRFSHFPIEALYALGFNRNEPNWSDLSKRSVDIHLLEANMDKIDWGSLSRNPAAIHLLEKNIDKIDWDQLSRNPAAMHLLEKHPDCINWERLSGNPSAIHLLKKHPDKISRYYFSENPAIFEINQPTYDAIIQKWVVCMNCD